MATPSSIQKGGHMRTSVVLKGTRAIDPDKSIPPAKLPPPISCKDVPPPTILQDGEPISSYTDIPSPTANGDQPKSKQEDHYGFLYSMSESDKHYEPVLGGKKAREREGKWLKMLVDWDVWTEKYPAKVKERCRKGIPPSLRGRAWQEMSGAKKLLLANAGLFDDLVDRPDNDVVVNVIDKDLDRTFPTHVLFTKPEGQQDLRRVLKAYAMYNTKTGYCQAMAPVAATLLMHMTAEEAFWVLVQICEQYLPGYYSPGLHAFQIDALILKALLTKYLPDVKKFMDSKLPPSHGETPESRRGLDPMLYCTEWFMSVFSRSLPWGSVLRVWDMFFFEGPKVLFKVALAILNLTFGSSKAQKKVPGFFELTRSLRNLSIDITHEDRLVPEMLKYRIHKEELHKYHLSQADAHFSEERARAMELQARRLRLHRRSPSAVSDATPSEVNSDI